MVQTMGVVTYLDETIGILDCEQIQCEYAVVFTNKAPTQELFVYRTAPVKDVLQVRNLRVRTSFEIGEFKFGNKPNICSLIFAFNMRQR